LFVWKKNVLQGLTTEMAPVFTSPGMAANRGLIQKK